MACNIYTFQCRNISNTLGYHPCLRFKPAALIISKHNTHALSLESLWIHQDRRSGLVKHANNAGE